ncbi:metallophosphoesterase [uncultured Ruminococcus sp.]|uniref:metallophosphoesterase family protein n=1 Tax=uncultured Ruminococcus sp. TaxID=165186 RepID=UPI0025E98A09|nr:metallophosphoesterase [uncultured Ruminococcus sp.]
MRIVVFSDTHGNYSAMHKIFKRNGDADLFIFLGDGESELKALKKQYIDSRILSVAGNCDMCSQAPESDVCTLPDGNRIFYTHGHKWHVKFSVDRLFFEAADRGCKIALFGHTHCRYAEYRDGILILNPGSAGCPRDGKPACYAWIDVTDGGIMYNHVDL